MDASCSGGVAASAHRQGLKRSDDTMDGGGENTATATLESSGRRGDGCGGPGVGVSLSEKKNNSDYSSKRLSGLCLREEKK